MFVAPVVLNERGVRLEPLALRHEDGLRAAAADGELWTLRVASVPEPAQTRAYIEDALRMREEGHRLAFAVVDETSGQVLGSTNYHDILPAVKRVEIGYTWYARSVQRTHVNTTCKLLMMGHAFDTLGCHVVGWRTDNFNFASQRAIERLGGKKDGVIRGHALRRDGTIRDTVMYSMRAGEWPEARAQLLDLRDRPRWTGGRYADRFLLHPARGQAAGFGKGVPHAAGSAAGRRGRADQPRRLQHGRLLLSRVPRWSRTKSTSTSSTAPLPPTSKASN